MTGRRPIQQSHERAYVKHFLNWFNRVYRSNFQVVFEPNPPEAVIRSARTTRWIEVTTAFWNEAFARDLFSYATPNETRKPVGPGPFFEMDKCFAQSFVSVAKKNLKRSPAFHGETNTDRVILLYQSNIHGSMGKPLA